MQSEITSGSLKLEDWVKKLLGQWDCRFPLRQVPAIQSSQTCDLCEKSNIEILFPFEMCLYHQGKDISGIQPTRLPWLQGTLHISLNQEKELVGVSIWQIFAWTPAPRFPSWVISERLLHLLELLVPNLPKQEMIPTSLDCESIKFVTEGHPTKQWPGQGMR